MTQVCQSFEYMLNGPGNTNKILLEIKCKVTGTTDCGKIS